MVVATEVQVRFAYSGALFAGADCVGDGFRGAVAVEVDAYVDVALDLLVFRCMRVCE